jgi:hypothetical protein
MLKSAFGAIHHAQNLLGGKTTKLIAVKLADLNPWGYFKGHPALERWRILSESNLACQAKKEVKIGPY